MLNTRMVPFVAALLGMTLLSACNSKYYDLKMRADGATLHRELSLPRIGDSAEDEDRALWEQERQRVAVLYGMDEPIVAEKLDVFRGAFETRTPDDLGGSGYFLHCNSPFGSTSAYSEQIRGQDDLAVDLESSRQSINALVDIGLQWLQSEFGDTDDFESLYKVVDEHVRHDLWNIALYTWTFSGIGPTLEPPGDGSFDEHIEGLLLMRLAHYLVERDYFNPQQLPKFIGAEADSDWRTIVTLSVRGIAKKMGVSANDPLPEALDRFRDDWKGYMASAEEFFEEADHQSPPGNSALSWELRLFDAGEDYLRAELMLPKEPYFHNGEWAGGKVSWQQVLAEKKQDGSRLPNALYAFWAEANVELQKQRFGQIVMDGEDLSIYCVWRQGLSNKRREDWDNFIATLQPGPSLVESLQEFAFDGEPEDSADEFISGIVNALQEPPEKKSNWF